MNGTFRKKQLTLAIAAAIGAGVTALTPSVASAQKTPGKYVAGDIHNHSTCSDGSTSMQMKVNRSVDAAPGGFGLDWFVQAGHGGQGNRNCTLVEDAGLATPAYPFVAGQGPTTTWVTSGVTVKGNVSGSGANRNMWRWQSLQEFQYPLLEYLNAYKNKPIFMGLETVNPGHEHTNVTVITGQIPLALDSAALPTAPPYVALGNGNAMSQWEYCFDRNDSDTSRGNATPQPSADGNNWDCSVPGSLNSADPMWSTVGQKLIPAGGAGTGNRGHAKSLEAVRWMQASHEAQSYFVPTHLERAGPFNPDGNNGFNVEHLRNFNNAAPRVAFGFETQPGHHASDARGEYFVGRNNFGGVPVDSVGGTTYGGTGVYGAVIGGVWDALLGEGRNYWFLGSSDWHNRGSFGSADRRSTQDFWPGEYQRKWTMVRNGTDKLRPQTIVDGMRSGNVFVTMGDLVDRFAFVACASYPGFASRSNASVQAAAVTAATNATDIDIPGCATMGEKLKVRRGADVIVSLVVRDPVAPNFSPYTFNNPSLAQVGISQPLNRPVLDHLDLIRGMVTGYRTPGAANYAGEWPRNLNWLAADGTTPANLNGVPDAAKNTTAALIRTFSATGPTAWTPVTSAVDGTTFLAMTYRIPAAQVQDSQYVRVRGTNLPPAVPFETDSSGNPLADIYTNAGNTQMLRIPCTVVGTNVPPASPAYTTNDIDGCPNHLPTAGSTSPIAGQRAVAFDVAAWADIWVYGNPIYVEVAGSTVIAGVQ